MITPPLMRRARGLAPAWRIASAFAACLALTAAALSRQDQQPPPEQQSQSQQGESPLRRFWSDFRRGAQPEQQPDQRAAEPPPPQPEAAPPVAPPPAVHVPAGEPGEFVDFTRFAEDVDLAALVDFVAHELGINIFSDPQIAGRMVRFNGPLQIRRDDLLDLLAYLLEQQGFGLVKEREGWYAIRPSGEVQVHVGADQFTTTRVIPTPMIRPSAIQAAVTGAISRAAAGSAGTKLVFSDELGAIIITDTPRTIQQVESLVELIVREFLSLPLHRFEVRHLNADVARSRIILLNGGGGGPGATSSGLAPNPNQQVGAATPIAAGTLSNLRDRLFVEGSSNALIFRGSPTEAEVLTRLVDIVDRPSRLIGRRYPAGPASATIAGYGQTMGLGPVTQTSASGRSPFDSFGAQAGRPTASITTATDAADGSRFVLEESGEAFVYFGTEEQHERVKALVDQYADLARAARVVVELYKLKHADAEDVADLLNALLERADQFAQAPFLPGQSRSRSNRAAASQDERTRERSRQAAANLNPASPESPDAVAIAESGGEEGVSLTPTEEVSIHADVARNQVIVKAPVRQQEEIAAIISRLDVRRPQVYLEAKIVSVTATDNFQFAIESQFNPGQAVLFTNFGLTTAGAAAGTQQAAQARRNVVAGVATTAATSGLTAAIIGSEYVPLVINALQRVGDTRIVSNPQLLVNDNEEAELISVREEPFAQTVQGTSTTQTSQGGVAEAGTKLTVTPQISEAGLLNLEYAVELSNFLASTGSTAGLQPPKQKENYRSKVTLPSDATMVIGGLTTENLRKSVAKIPLLGDIPLIGELFRSTTKDSARTTIYVFIRPVIMRDPNFRDLRLLTQGPMDRVNAEPDVPPLEPVRIPIQPGAIGPPRQSLDLRPVDADHHP